MLQCTYTRSAFKYSYRLFSIAAHKLHSTVELWDAPDPMYRAAAAAAAAAAKMISPASTMRDRCSKNIPAPQSHLDAQF